MAFLDLFRSKKKEAPKASTILPKEVYDSSVLDLKDIIAPSALKIGQKSLDLGDKVGKVDKGLDQKQIDVSLRLK